MNLTPDGSALIVAEFGANQLLRCQLASGEVTVLCDEVGGRPPARPNYPVVMPDGTIVLHVIDLLPDLALSLIMRGRRLGSCSECSPTGRPTCSSTCSCRMASPWMPTSATCMWCA